MYDSNVYRSASYSHRLSGYIDIAEVTRDQLRVYRKLAAATWPRWQHNESPCLGHRPSMRTSFDSDICNEVATFTIVSNCAACVDKVLLLASPEALSVEQANGVIQINLAI